MNAWTLGLIAGLATAVLWTFTALFFEEASRRLGSLNVNFGRLAIAAILFLGLLLARSGSPFDPTMDAGNWLWLGLSGLVGFAIGDLLLFEAFVLIGSRLSMLVYASVPPITAVIGAVFLGEALSGPALAGMILTVGGIALATATKPRQGRQEAGGTPRGVRFAKGLIYAFGGSLGQALGLILGKHGAEGHDSFSSTQIRVIAGLIGFSAILSLKGSWKDAGRALLPFGIAEPGRWKARSFMAAGSVLGPFFGVSLGLLSTQLTTAGVGSTLMALVPVFIILPASLVFKERVSAWEVAGAVLACGGAAIMFL
jgi:drug/metabolite transporter (DMT)-like permease